MFYISLITKVSSYWSCTIHCIHILSLEHNSNLVKSILTWFVHFQRWENKDSETKSLSHTYSKCQASQLALVVKNPPDNAGDEGLIPVLERSSGEGHGNPLQYSCLENPTERGTWQTTVHSVAKSQTWLKWLSMYAHIASVRDENQSQASRFQSMIFSYITWSLVWNQHFECVWLLWTLWCFLLRGHREKVANAVLRFNRI